jgi:helix-turn-helix protein/uncharacterized protein DUF4115
MSLLGDRLRQERDARAISLFQVEIDTRIRAAVLQALEEGDYTHLPPEPFLRGLVRSYANYLRIDPEEMLKLLSIDLVSPSKRSPAPSSLAKNYAPPPTQMNGPEKATETEAQEAPESGGPAEAPEYEIEAPATTTASNPLEIQEFIERLRRFPVPMPVLISAGVVIAFVCVICGVIALGQLSSNVLPAAASRGSVTPTRTPTSLLPTSAPGAGPTDIPKLALTAAPFPTFPGNPSPTPKVLPKRTLETQTGLNLDIDANAIIKVLVGVDSVPQFNGTMDPGTSRSWSAKDSLYVRVENAINANIYFNGKEVKAATYAERSVIERRWIMDKGTPKPAPLATPIFPTPTRTPTITPIFTVTPIVFDTPKSTPPTSP